ncbi:MAG: type II toxin-antitoxin system RelE/ParE family toxin [Candidatus Thermoplasmatota archaeon]
MGLKYAPEVQDFVRTLAPGPKKQLRKALDAIRDDPRPSGFDVKVLRKDGSHSYFRLRVGDYRIVYTPRGAQTYVWRIIHRSEGYDWFERLDP